MSLIPPNWLGSILQTAGAERRAAERRAQDAAAAAERLPTFAESLQNVIEETDRDSQVYSDAEGTGSQGRPSEPPPDQATADEAAPEAPPTGGLDVQA
mgnify:CR=1 FL=1